MTGRIRRYLPEDWDMMAVVVFLALALRVYFALAFDVRYMAGYGKDFAAAVSEPFPAGDGAPLYPLFMRVFLALSGGRTAAVYIIQAIVDSAAVIMVLYAGTFLFSRRAGFAAAILATLYPGYILGVISPTPAAAVVFLSAALVTIGAAEVRGKIGQAAEGRGGIGPSRGAALSALAAGAGILTEPSFLFLVPGLLLVSRRRTVFILVLAGLLLPWAIGNSAARGKIVPLYNSETWGFDLDKYRADDLTGYWRPVRKIYENAAAFTSRGWASYPEESVTVAERDSTYAAAYSYVAIMVLGIVGLVKLYGQRSRPVFLPFVMYFILLILFSTFAARQRIILEPLLVLCAGALIGGVFRTSVRLSAASTGRGTAATSPGENSS